MNTRLGPVYATLFMYTHICLFRHVCCTITLHFLRCARACTHTETHITYTPGACVNTSVLRIHITVSACAHLSMYTHMCFLSITLPSLRTRALVYKHTHTHAHPHAHTRMRASRKPVCVCACVRARVCGLCARVRTHAHVRKYLCRRT